MELSINTWNFVASVLAAGILAWVAFSFAF